MLNVPVSLVVYLILSLLVFVILVFFFIIIQKKLRHDREVHYLKQKERLRPIVFEYLSRDEEPISRHLQTSQFPFEIIDELLEEYGELLKGENIQAKIRDFAAEHLIDYYRENLQSRRWHTRMNALYRVEDLSLKQLTGIVWERYIQNNMQQEEHHLVIRTLAKLQSKELEELLIKGTVDFPLFLYKDILRRWEEETFMRFVKQVDTLPINFQKGILELIGERKEISLIPFIEEQLVKDDLELRISSLKSIYTMGIATAVESYLPFASSPFWQERMLFAKISGKLLKDRFKPLLTTLISDENWFVRSAAGEALSYYQDGQMILQYIMQEHEDSFARDTARQWIQRGVAH